MTIPVTKINLPNGLSIHLKEIHSAPLISHWVWYRVGSRNETDGIRGVSHWVEHMQFKGTPTFPAGVLDKSISRCGAFWNAFTYLDWTTYFETFPADKINLALELESDRMQNSLFDPQEVDSERTVVISELEGNENEPSYRLGRTIQQTAFRKHPYHYEIIGELADLQKMSRDDLYNYYHTNYCPNNALVCVAGDFNTKDMLKRIEDAYGNIPSQNVSLPKITQEGAPSSEDRVEINGPGETTYMEIAYHAPSAADSDFFAFTILDSLLTGPSSLNMFGGGGTSNKTSRLYRALVENELAVSAYGGLNATIDPFLYSINTIIHPKQTYPVVLEKIDEEIYKLQTGKTSQEEIDRAVKQARALFAYGSENITNQGFWLGYAEMFASYDWFVNYVENLSRITPDDIQHIARKYLAANQRVVGAYIPENKPEI